MKNAKRIVPLILVLLVICAVLAGCGKDSLVGSWINENHAEQIILYEDGSALVHGSQASWYTEGDVLRLQMGIRGNQTFRYELDGDTLYLNGNAFRRG